MGGISPIQLFIIPFVFLFALPLAIFAGVTTVLAFLVLYLRLTIAYFDVGLDTIRFLVLGNGAYYNRQQLEYLGTASPASPSSPLGGGGRGGTPRPSSPGTPASYSSSSTRRQHPHHRRGGRGLGGGGGGGGGSASSGSLTPVASLAPPLPLSSVGFDRDFEGIGGWRLAASHGGVADNDDDDDDAEQQWYRLNSRLELPDRRHHYRSRSGGAVLSSGAMSGTGLHTMVASASASARTGSVSPGALRMTAPSPNSSRPRTPNSSWSPYYRGFGGSSSNNKSEHDEYFLSQEKKHVKKLSA